LFEPAKGIEQGAMGRRVDQPALLGLTLDLDQGVAESAQQRHRGRLVVDIGAAAAVGGQRAAQDQGVILGLDAALGKDGAGRVGRVDGEARGHRRAPGAGANQGAVGAGTECQPEGIEEDRFAGACFAGQYAEAHGKIEVEAVDQYDVADGQAGQHGVLGQFPR
jgi:hypothetical protein